MLNASGNDAGLAEAERLVREALAERLGRLGADHPDVVGTRHTLASTLYRRGAFEASEAEYRRVLAYHRSVAPADSGELAFVTKNLAVVLQDRGALAEAEALLRESVALRRAYFGPSHPSLAVALHSLAALLRNAQRPAEAGAPAQEALAVTEAARGPDHPHTPDALSLLGSILRGRGRLDDAAEALAAVAARARGLPGGPSPGYPVYLNDYANVLVLQERYDEAEAVAVHALAVNRERYGDVSDGTGAALSRLASIARGRGDVEAAVQRHREALARFDAYFDAPNLFSAFEQAALPPDLDGLVPNPVPPGELAGELHRGPLVVELALVLGRRQAAQSRVRTVLIVVPAPRLDQGPGLLERGEMVLVQALGPQLPIERFDERIVRWGAKTAEFEPHTIALRALLRGR